jgi:hypothetical protein
MQFKSTRVNQSKQWPESWDEDNLKKQTKLNNEV